MTSQSDEAPVARLSETHVVLPLQLADEALRAYYAYKAGRLVPSDTEEEGKVGDADGTDQAVNEFGGEEVDPMDPDALEVVFGGDMERMH